MEKLLELISPYNFLNNLMPGAVFFHAVNYFCGATITFANYIDYLFIYYFLGLVISRIGSVVIEPIFDMLKLRKKAPYELFVKVSKEDKKLDALSEINNVYRTFLAGTVLITAVKIVLWLCSISKFIADSSVYIALVSLILLFGFSFRKQTGLIEKRIDAQQTRETTNMP